MAKKWHSGADYGLRNIDVEAVIRREILIQQGRAGAILELGAAAQGEIISSLTPQHYICVFFACRASDSAIQAQAEQPMLPFGRSGISLAHAKVVAQMRRGGAPKSPLIEGPAAEEGFVYPREKVISIRKGHRLKKKV